MTDQKPNPAQMTKDQIVNLTEIEPALKNVVIGIGWDAPEKAEGYDLDIDASAFLLGQSNRVRFDQDFVFYNNIEAEQGCVIHQIHNLSGGDKEQIVVSFEKLSFDVEKISVCMTVHNAEERFQNLSVVNSAYMRVVDQDTGREMARYEMKDFAAGENGLLFGELIRDVEGWKFHAIGQGTDGGLYRIASDYGVNVAPN